MLAFTLTALTAMFIFDASNVSGLRQAAQARTRGKLHELLSCDFCCLFWLLVVSSLFYSVLAGPHALLAPLSVSMVVRLMRL